MERTHPKKDGTAAEAGMDEAQHRDGGDAAILKDGNGEDDATANCGGATAAVAVPGSSEDGEQDGDGTGQGDAETGEQQQQLAEAAVGGAVDGKEGTSDNDDDDDKNDNDGTHVNHDEGQMFLSGAVVSGITDLITGAGGVTDLIGLGAGTTTSTAVNNDDDEEEGRRVLDSSEGSAAVADSAATLASQADTNADDAWVEHGIDSASKSPSKAENANSSASAAAAGGATSRPSSPAGTIGSLSSIPEGDNNAASFPQKTSGNSRRREQGGRWLGGLSGAFQSIQKKTMTAETKPQGQAAAQVSDNSSTSDDHDNDLDQADSFLSDGLLSSSIDSNIKKNKEAPRPSKVTSTDRFSSIGVSDHTRPLTPTGSILSSCTDLEASQHSQPVDLLVDGNDNVEIVPEDHSSRIVNGRYPRWLVRKLGRKRLIAILLGAFLTILFIAITAGTTAKKKKNRSPAATAGAMGGGNSAAAAPGCGPAYVEHQPYQAGDQVSNGGKTYVCRNHPYSGFCSQAAWAFAPGTGSEWKSAWEYVHDCTDETQPGSRPGSSSGKKCAPAYKENKTYRAGQRASNDGKNYKCREEPYDELCSGDPWAYEPGRGVKWDLPWLLIGECVPKDKEENSPAASAPSPSPTKPTISTAGSSPTKPTRPSNTKQPGQKTIVGYYASWQWYDRSRLATPANMDFAKVHRVNFAFFQTDADGNIWGTDSWADPQVLFGPTNWNARSGDPEYCSWDGPNTKNCNSHYHEEGLIGLAHAAGSEVYPSIGGWTLSDAFPAMAASSTARRTFARKCVELIQDYDFDGIDLDWEYPGYEDHSGTPADTANFNLLLDDIRRELDVLSVATGRTYGLTAALPCGPDKMADIDIAHVAGVLSELNLMTYDFFGAWDERTGVNAPLYPQGWGETGFDVDSCVNNWIAGGGSRSTINIGLAFYGRSFRGASGLNQLHGGADTNQWHEDEGTPQYYNIRGALKSMTAVRDKTTKTQYAYFNGGGLVSYDDERSICDKTDYVLENNLNGFIIWELSGDLMPDLSTPLLDAVNVKLADPTFVCGDPLPAVVPPAYGLRPAAESLSSLSSAPTASPISAVSTDNLFLPSHPSHDVDTHQKPSDPTAIAVEAVLKANRNGINNKLFLYQTPQNSWEPSSVYRFSGFISGLRVMYQSGVASKYFHMGDSSESGHLYGLVNIAAFLAQSMKETIKYDACDENSWDLVNGRYPLSNACGQLGQSYQDYHCSKDEAYMECKVDPKMQITAVTNAKWYGAPGPLKCGPKSAYPWTGSWDYSKECNKPWANPPESCSDYEGQKAGGENNVEPFANSNGRTDVEGCCYWGRGVIQTTGICNFGKLNYYLGKRAADEGRPSRYPTIDFCADPEAICASEEFTELKWIAGLFYWTESVQTYNQGGWNYMDKLYAFVDDGMSDLSFIDAVSGIVNRGCHNPPCGTGALDGGQERKENFLKVLSEFELL